MNGCPVLHELEVTEDYQPEHENAPVLSGGDYDISAIRSCGEDCLLGAYAWQRLERIRGIAAILGLSSGDTSEIEDTIRETLRSRDEWLEQATKNAGRIEELTALNRRMLMAFGRAAYVPRAESGPAACVEGKALIPMAVEEFDEIRSKLADLP